MQSPEQGKLMARTQQEYIWSIMPHFKREIGRGAERETVRAEDSCLTVEGAEETLFDNVAGKDISWSINSMWYACLLSVPKHGQLDKR